MADPDFLRKVERDLVDKGLLIEAGWVGLRLAMGLENAPARQLDDMRSAFFGGAQHLFMSIMGFLEDGEDATEADLERMDRIHGELDRFIQEFCARHNLPPPGTGSMGRRADA